MGRVLDINHAFGRVLRDLRKKAGISQEKLALDANLDRTFISLLERGLRQPSLKTIFTIANVLEIQPHEIVRAVEDEIIR
ncbi:MAG: helix-turn-helix transcriptional regulator [Mariprofundaceae bacterium]|nr:helix-turn-helix transcriptional regulator [Mariprofundaceae bacterium]